MSLSTLADACSPMSSNIAQKDLVGHKGQYPIYGASGLIGFVNFYKQEQQYIAVVKDGAGIGRVFSLPPYSSVIGTMQYLLPKDSIDVNYLYYAVQFMHLEKYYTGSTIPHIYFKDYKHEPLNIPSRDKQQEISSILILVDKAIDTLHAQITHLEELVKSRFVELFGEPVTNPKGWKTNSLKNLGELNRGVSKHRPRNDPELLNGSYPLVQTGDVSNADTYIKEYSSTYSEVGLKQSRMWSKGTLCITIAANIAKTGILTFDACFPDSVVGFIPGEQTNQIYIHHWFSFFQKILEEQAPQSAQKNINLQILGNLSVMLPPLALQNEFVAFVEQTDKSKFAVLMHRQILLKTALLSAMFSSYTNSDRRICKSLHRRSVDNDEL